MTKSLAKYNFPSEFKTLRSNVKSVEKMHLFLSENNLTEVNTTGLTNFQIDEAVAKTDEEFGTLPENGRVISDPTNKLLLVRQAAVWRKVSVT